MRSILDLECRLGHHFLPWLLGLDLLHVPVAAFKALALGLSKSLLLFAFQEPLLATKLGRVALATTVLTRVILEARASHCRPWVLGGTKPVIVWSSNPMGAAEGTLLVEDRRRHRDRNGAHNVLVVVVQGVITSKYIGIVSILHCIVAKKKMRKLLIPYFNLDL